MKTSPATARAFALAWMAIGAAAGSTSAAPAVSAKADKIPWKFADEKGGNVCEVDVQQVVLENEYVRAVITPSLGGRIAQLFDKPANADVFQREEQPIKWNVKARFTAYNSQLGGVAVNFPCFHNCNSFSDNWNWHVERVDGGGATVVMAWMDKYLRQRVVVRVTLRPGDAALTSEYRYFNLNPFGMGFAPWVNAFFPSRTDAELIIPSQQVVPHGFNSGTLEVLPWSWPKQGFQGSVFALDVERDFSGVYFQQLDRGLARLFDRREQRGVKIFAAGEALNYFEIWSSPALLHEDALWWEGCGTRRYQDVWLPVHGIGGYREANAHGALNLVRGQGRIDIGGYAAHPVRNAVVTLAGIDGVWWRRVADLAPDKPLRETIMREPGRMPLRLEVTDAEGQQLIRLDDQPDPGLHREAKFTGTSLWKTDPLREALRAEQYYPLWRGGTGSYQPFAQIGTEAYRRLLAGDPNNLEARLGLARSLMVDAQLRGPERPGCGSAAEVAAFQSQQLAAAMESLTPVMKEPGAALLAGEVKWRQGDARASADCFEKAGDDALARFGLARALAALGKAREAAGPAGEAARALPGSPPAAQLAAGIAVLRKEPGEAFEYLKVVHRHDPLDPVTLTLLSLAQKAAGKNPLAAAMEQQLDALQAQTDDPIDVPGELRRLGLETLLVERGGAGIDSKQRRSAAAE
ncbi:MAG: DUF5107 domain-containing protein [Planctomycetota bacterium]